MSLSGWRRCFECDAMFPVSALAGATPIHCPNDGSPLGLEMAGRRWRLEAVLGPRVGGGVFVAHHVITGMRAAVSLLYDAREGELEDRLDHEVQAQRMLEPHPNLFPLIELGSERDGTRFYVSDLGTEQTLREALAEWRRPEDVGELFSQVGALIRPLLGLLSAAHRMGIAHGALDTTQVYVAVIDVPQGMEPILVKPRLYGLRRIGQGPALANAVRADLFAIGQLMFQMMYGEPARLPLSHREQTAICRQLGEARGSFVLRALGCSSLGSESSFATIEDMQRELIALRRDISTNELDAESAACVPIDPMTERTAPTAAPSRMPDSRRSRASSRITTPGGATPLPEMPSQVTPQRCGISGELRQVSFADLLTLPQPMPTNEVMARGKSQVSLPDQAVPLRMGRTSSASWPSRAVEVGQPAFLFSARGDFEDIEIEVMTERRAALPVSDLLSESTRDLRTQILPGAGSFFTEPTKPPAIVPRAQPARSKFWSWWRR